MKKIYLVCYDNGGYSAQEYGEDIFKYCYTTKGQATKAIEELKQDKNFLEEIASNTDLITDVDFWIKEIELID